MPEVKRSSCNKRLKPISKTFQKRKGWVLRSMKWKMTEKCKHLGERQQLVAFVPKKSCRINIKIADISHYHRIFSKPNPPPAVSQYTLAILKVKEIAMHKYY
jgi:hypothetical protein